MSVGARKSVRPELVEGLSLPASEEIQSFDKLRTNGVRGKLTPNAPLAPLVWFKAGGAAEYLFEPADVDDLAQFLADLDPAVPVMALGLGSNLIVRDGGVPGVVVRLGKPFAAVETLDAVTLKCGGGASGILVSSKARDAGIGGVEFLRSIPGTVGGFVRMKRARGFLEAIARRILIEMFDARARPPAQHVERVALVDDLARTQDCAALANSGRSAR